MPPTTSPVSPPAPAPQRKGVLSGPAMRRHLLAQGITAQRVTYKRQRGCYVAEFYVPEMQTPVAPAGTWARQITACGLRVLNTEDTIATWRAGQPVIHAAVTFAPPG